MEEQVLRLANLGAESGIGGIVASPHEIFALRSAHGSKIRIVTPGSARRARQRATKSASMTPAEALRAGADFLVIGRPITAAPDPRAAFEQIVADAV